MADIGGLVADVGLNVAGLRSDIGKATRELQRGTNRMNRHLGSLRKSVDRAIGGFKGLVGVVGAVGFARMMQQSIAATAALDEQADAANVNVEKFQELTKAFSDMAGVTESITAGGLRRFNRRLGLARQGTGAAVKTLERLNISLRQDTTSALDEAVRKIAAMDSATDQAAAASQLFGEDAGPKMAAALAQGKDALDKTIRKLREQGRIMSEETASDARKLNDRYNELTDTLQTKFRRAVLGSIGLIEKLGTAMAHAFSDESMTPFDEQIEATRKRLAQLEKITFKGDETVKRIKFLRAELERLKRAQLELLTSGGGTAEGTARSGPPAILKKIDAQRAKMTSQAGLTRGGNPLEAFGDGARRANREMSQSLRLLDRSVSGPTAILKKIDAQRAKMTSQAGLTRGGNPLEAFGDGARRANREMSQSLRLLDRIDDQVRRTEKSGLDFGFTFQSAFEDAIIKGRKLGDVFKGLADDIQRIILRQTITQPLGNAVSGFVSSMFSGSTPSGLAGTGGSAGPVAAFAGGGFTGSGPRSGGMDGKGGFPAILHPNETVVDHRKGGGGTTVNIINEGGPEPEVSRRSGPGGDVVDVVIPAINRAIQSGGVDGTMRKRFGLTPSARSR